MNAKTITAVTEALRRAMQARLDAGRLPYDGHWVTLPEMQQAILDERKRARVHAIELVLFFCLILFTSYLVIAVVTAICY